jgi:hypothetical protein
MMRFRIPMFTESQLQEMADRAGVTQVTILRRLVGLPVRRA